MTESFLLDLPALRAQGMLGKPVPFKYEMRFDNLSADGKSPTPFHVEGELRLNSTGFQVSGQLYGSIQQICDRCTQEYAREIEEPIDESFAYQELMSPKGAGEYELQADDFYETHPSDEPFDVKRLVEELLIIALSYDRFCSESDCLTQA